MPSQEKKKEKETTAMMSSHSSSLPPPYDDDSFDFEALISVCMITICEYLLLIMLQPLLLSFRSVRIAFSIRFRPSDIMFKEWEGMGINHP